MIIMVKDHDRKVFACDRCFNAIVINVKTKCQVTLGSDSCSDTLPANLMSVRADVVMRCEQCGKQMIELDFDIAPAIVKLWKSGIKTYMCCHGHYDQWTSLGKFDPVDNPGKDPERDNILICGPYIDFIYNDELYHKIKEVIAQFEPNLGLIYHIGFRDVLEGNETNKIMRVTVYDNDSSGVYDMECLSNSTMENISNGEKKNADYHNYKLSRKDAIEYMNNLVNELCGLE